MSVNTCSVYKKLHLRWAKEKYQSFKNKEVEVKLESVVEITKVWLYENYLNSFSFSFLMDKME